MYGSHFMMVAPACCAAVRAAPMPLSMLSKLSRAAPRSLALHPLLSNDSPTIDRRSTQLLASYTRSKLREASGAGAKEAGKANPAFSACFCANDPTMGNDTVFAAVPLPAAGGSDTEASGGEVALRGELALGGRGAKASTSSTGR